MKFTEIKPADASLEKYLITNADASWNLEPKDLETISIDQNMATRSSLGAISINTGKFTGRSPKDRFIVKDSLTEDAVWWGDINIPFDADKFDNLQAKMG